MPVRLFFTTLLICTLITPFTWAADKPWHEGTVLSVERQERTTTTKHSSTEYSQGDKVKAEAKSTTSEIPVEVYLVFTITDGQRTYVARQGNTIWHSKSKAQPGDKIQFAVDGDSLYIRQNDDKEVKLKVLKSSLAPTNPESR